MTKTELQEILSSPYDPKEWERVLREILGVRTYYQEPVPINLPKNDLAESAAEIGNFETSDGRLVGLYEIQLTDKPRIWQNRVGLRTLLRNVYRHDVDAALVVFNQNDKWRLSLISEIRVRDGEGGFVAQQTEPKRYTYLLGHSESVRTALDRLEFYSGTERKLDHLLSAFSVDTLNKDFFSDYDKVFKRVEEEVKRSIPDTNRNDKEAAERRRLFTQRLFNRLMFIYFLQKKGWLKFEGDTDYLRRLFTEAHTKGEKYFSDRLFWVFFSGLGEVESAELHSAALLRERRGELPYLNGGLFEKDDDGFDERGRIDLANHVFSNDRKEGILDLFEQYNFTIDESSPLDVQVAVDPEMLGKVFEELVTRRGDTGSYYTPRTIVQFMCREALTGFLSSTGIAQAKLRKIVYDYSVEDLSVADARTLLQKLAEIRIVDPACGSGAYLLGVLQELTTLTGLLDTRANNDQKEIFDRKLEIIKTNLYGVDIDKFAVQIARLRLWLSLAVDFIGDKPQPLPNLDFKIECGDSLTAPDPSQANLARVHDDVEKYKKVKAKFLMSSITHKHDRDYRESLLVEIRRLRKEIGFWLHSNAGGNVPAEAFDWALEFAEVFDAEDGAPGGFDVVLANPPYGAKVGDNVRDLYFDRRAEGPQSKDTYGLFMARGIQLLSRGGTLSYIVSDTWRTIKSHLPLRRRILTQCTIHHFLDLPSWVFDATVNTCILTLTKTTPSPGNVLIAGDLRNIPNRNWKMLEDNLRVVSVHGFDAQTVEYARYSYPQGLISSHDNLSFFVASPALYRWMSDKDLIRFGDIGDAPHGLSTGNNRKYIRAEADVRGTPDKIEEWMKVTPQELANLTLQEKTAGLRRDWRSLRGCFVPLEKGGESNAADGWLPNYYVPTKYFINWAEGSIRDMRRNPGFRWINVEYFFRRGLTFSISGIYAPTFRLNSAGVFEAKGSGIFCDSIEDEVLLGIFCSRLARYQFKTYIKHSVDTSGDDIREFRLPHLTDEVRQRIKKLVGSIIRKQAENERYPYQDNEQREIDKIVYDLYSLTPEEIREIDLWYCRRYQTLARAQGTLEEVRENYADHLARCERILSKPPEYWQSNPVLSLIAQGEGSELEFKETLEANNTTGESLPALVTASLKTIAAFANTKGGTLLIGVADTGEVKGLALDYELCKPKNIDGFEQKLQNLIKDRLKIAVGKVIVSFEHLPEGDVCRVDVEPIRGVTYDGNDVYVRNGNITEKLVGQRLVEWSQERT